MPRVSVLIASRNEKYICETVESLYSAASGPIEVLVAFDGQPYVALDERPGLRWWYQQQAGMRAQINFLAEQATSDILMKLDAHCSVSQGWDVALTQHIEDNWLVVPRLYVLDAERWRWQDDRFYDYFYLCCPLTDKKMYRFQAGGHWPERTLERLSIGPLDDTMQFQGACWLVTKRHWFDHLGGFLPETYERCGLEPTELGLKTWLGPWDGQCVVNKSAWYAHMHKGGQRARGYDYSAQRIRAVYKYDVDFWMLGKWEQQARPLKWLVNNKFWPVPGWPKNWEQLEAEYRGRA